MFVQLEPPLLETCHCTDGVGLPDAAAVNDTGAPAVTVLLAGFAVTTGALWTVNVAALLATPLATTLLNTARYSLLFCDAVVAAIVSVRVALPASVVSFVQLEPPRTRTPNRPSCRACPRGAHLPVLRDRDLRGGH